MLLLGQNKSSLSFAVALHIHQRFARIMHYFNSIQFSFSPPCFCMIIQSIVGSHSNLTHMYISFTMAGRMYRGCTGIYTYTYFRTLYNAVTNFTRSIYIICWAENFSNIYNKHTIGTPAAMHTTDTKTQTYEHDNNSNNTKQHHQQQHQQQQQKEKSRKKNSIHTIT